MSYQVIARKYRPQKFSEIVGQGHITRTLQNAIAMGRLHHAYLFTGIRGIGKTTLARIFAKILNCKAPVGQPIPEPCNSCQSCNDITNSRSIDVQEIDGASNTGVDDVREIRERVKFLPAVGKYKIYIIDEVHMLSTAAFNALLKTLEEPPAHVIFIFATTEAQKIPSTILSRCQRYDFRRIASPKIIETLKTIATSEGVTADEECLEIIVTESEGSMRDAESLFDQAIAFAGKRLTTAHLKDLLGFLDKSQINSAVRAITEKKPAAALSIAEELFQGGENLSRFVSELLTIFHNLLLIKSTKELPPNIKVPDVEYLQTIAKGLTLEECQILFNMTYKGLEDISRTRFPKTILDILLINLTNVRPVRSVDEILDGLKKLQPAAITNSRPSAMPSGKEQPQSSSGFPEFLDWLKLNKPQVASFLDSSIGGSIQNSTLVIKFKTRSFASEQIMEEGKKSFLEKLTLDFFKRPLKIAVEFDNADENANAAQKKKQQEETTTKHKLVKEEALKHDVIRGAANIFGAEIREIKVK